MSQSHICPACGRPPLASDLPIETLSAAERSMRGLYLRLEKAAAEEGFYLTAAQLLLLARMEERGTPVAELYGTAYFGTNLSYNLIRLSADGYTSRRGSESDRRVGIYALTPVGMKVRSLVLQILDGEQSVLQSLGAR
jgi:DNA-binding MarR family transcriptional regulator